MRSIYERPIASGVVRSFTRFCVLILACAGLLLGVASCGVSPVVQERPHTVVPAGRVDSIRRILLDSGDPQILIVAHRGHHRDVPENSLPAIVNAAAAGAHVAEIDVRRTRDGHLVIMHDATVDRTTNGKGKVDTLTLAELQGLQLMDGLRPTTQRVPTLDDAFKAAGDQIMLNLDPKGAGVRELAQAARAAGALDRVILKERWDRLSPDDLAWARQNPDVFLMPICRSKAEVDAAMAVYSWRAIEIVAEKPGDPLLAPETIAHMRGRGVRVWVNTLWNGRLAGGLGDEQAVLDPDLVFGQVGALGFGIVQTDLPEVAQAVLSRLGSKQGQKAAGSGGRDLR